MKESVTLSEPGEAVSRLRELVDACERGEYDEQPHAFASAVVAAAEAYMKAAK